jgi:hypothetical protein
VKAFISKKRSCIYSGGLGGLRSVDYADALCMLQLQHTSHPKKKKKKKFLENNKKCNNSANNDKKKMF